MFICVLGTSHSGLKAFESAITIGSVKAVTNGGMLGERRFRVRLRRLAGRRLSVLLYWFASLLSATSSQLKYWEILGVGEGVHWPQLDEDLSVSGLLWGNPVRR